MSRLPAGRFLRGVTRRRAALALAWLVAFLVALALYVPTNDHFYRIAAGRQIARYGELPFRDFLDPGLFGTELISATMQLAFGDHLLGEILVNVAATATGAVLVLLLAHRASASWPIAATAAVSALALRPRAYDYDKFLLFPLGLWLCYRYYDAQRRRDLVWLAAGIVVAASVRYDNGLYIACAAAAGMIALHGMHRATWLRLTTLAACIVVCALPVAWFINAHGGIVNAFDQVATYAAREGARTRMLHLPPLSSANGVDAETLAGIAGYAFLALPLAAAVVLLARRRLGDHAHLWSAIVLCLLLDAFILRDPLSARIGGIAGPPAVLAAFLATPVTRLHRYWLAAGALVLTLAAASVFSRVESGSLVARLDMSRAASALDARSRSPQPLDHLPPAVRGIVAYLRQCTTPDHRVLLTWFAPEVYFFAQRGFAAGAGVLFGAHWSEPRFQQRMLAKLSTESVPLVIRHDNRGESPFRLVYPLIDDYLGEQYRVAGATNFTDTESPPGSYEVLIRKDLQATQRREASGLPCLTGG